MATTTDLRPEARVRAIWDAYARGGPAAIRDVVEEDVEWVPLGTGRAVPHADFIGEWGRRHAERVSVTVHGYETHGSCVLVHGSLRTFADGGFVDVQPSWVYFFEGVRLVRAVGYATREEALRAIEAAQAP